VLTAIFVLRQSSSVHLINDGAAYDGSTGELHSVDLVKGIALPDQHMAIACNGPALLGQYLGERIADEFASFDDFVSRGEVLLPDVFQDYAEDNCDGDAFSTFYVVGWHRHATPRPAAYCMNLWTDDSTRLAQVVENSSADSGVQRFKFEELLFSGTPGPSGDLMTAAGFRIPDDVNDMRPEIDLLHLLEIARHEEIEDHHWVGGRAVLTSIDASGVTQKTLHIWEEDLVGDLITPLPIDWKAWRAALTTADIPTGLSRLQRERMEKKARKGTLRAA
jgi:hypothetical protein